MSGLNAKLPILENVGAMVRHADGTVDYYTTHNIITDAGDIYYAQKACGETPTNTFANLYLGSTSTPSTGKSSTYASITPIASTSKAVATGYPKSNDSDTNNSGRAVDVITWKFAYTANDFTAASVTELIIAKSGASGTDPVLCHAAFAAAFVITATDQLTVYVNHTCNGT
jgi:hypothetical protein